VDTTQVLAVVGAVTGSVGTLFEQQGYTATPDDLHLVASDAYRRASGGSIEDYLDAFEDAG
jgi:hypothetical protein